MDLSNYKNYLPIIIGLLGIVLVGVGIVGPKLKNEEPEIVVTKGEILKQVQDDNKKIIIDVEGAVERPGVYELPNDSRIADALIPAGGLSANADRETIAKTINLAQKLTDGTKIYFPFVNESVTNSKTNKNELININNASMAELDSLVGIGPATAQKIIDNRPYQNISDLLTKKILGSSVYNSLKTKLSVY